MFGLEISGNSVFFSFLFNRFSHTDREIIAELRDLSVLFLPELSYQEHL